MNRFQTVRDAKEYLIRRILEQADRDGVHLSDIERDMLYFSETGWTLPNMMFISRVFDQNYDQDKYERKIGQIIRRIYDQPDSNSDGWNDALQRLREEDHYLLVLIDGALSEPEKTSRWEIVIYLLVGGVVALLLLPIGFFLESRRQSSSIEMDLRGLGPGIGRACCVPCHAGTPEVGVSRSASSGMSL